VSLAVLMVVAIWLNRQPLLDIIMLGWMDQEQSHIFLAPAVAIWLLWLRRTRLRYVSFQPNLIGPVIVAGGWLLSWWGFESGTQIAWHGGALITLLGVLLSYTGLAPLWLFAPVFAVFAFMLPVPGALRHAIAHPMQQYATSFTHSMLELLGVIAVKSGNVLTINGQQVAVGEACNGMRMVFALTLIVYAFAFGTPLRPSSRLVVIALSPFIAMLCNVIRLVPTSLIYGYGSVEFAQTFHDVAGWVMLPIALLMLMWVLRTIKWLEFPVTSFRLASQ
jgi:exosortase